MSLVLSIAAKFLEKPRSLDDFFGFGADSLGILAIVGHVTNEIDYSDSLSIITKKAVLRAQEDIKDIIRSAIPAYNTQNTNSRSLSDGQHGLAMNIMKKIVPIVDEQVKTNFRATIRDRFGGF